MSLRTPRGGGFPGAYSGRYGGAVSSEGGETRAALVGQNFIATISVSLCPTVIMRV